MDGAGQMAAPRLAAYKARLDRYLLDAVRLVGADGSPLIQGRSLVYRFAAAAPFWVGALAQTSAVPPGLLRRAAAGIVKHFVEHGAPDDDGLLTLGWFHPWRRMAQRYSGPGSPYWASKGLLGLALPASHPVWTSVEQPLPVQQADQLAVIGAPGWVLSATRADGIVRIHNHGTDHALPGDRTGDSPLYARLGYSTATAPVLSDQGWDAPLDQSVVLLDAAGNATHRSGFEALGTCELDGAALLASRARCHWVDPDRTAPDHGSGRPGAARDAATVTTVSIVRGAWEVRCVRIDPADASGWSEVVALRVGGWPLTAAEPHTTRAIHGAAPHALAWSSSGLTSTAVSLVGFTESGVVCTCDATPLGRHTATPWLSVAPRPHAWAIAALALGAETPCETRSEPAAPRAELAGSAAAPHVSITWPDGFSTTAPLPASEKGRP
jgi:hypothetical protein